MNENIRTQLVSGFIVVVLLGGAGYYVYRSNQSVEPSSVGGDTATTTPGTESAVGAPAGSASEVADVATPDLSRSFAAPARLPESIRKESESKYATAVANLREDSSRWNSWMEVAVYRKGSDDFKGAEEVWLYVTDRWPTDTTAYANLADLYANYLTDYSNAETYYRRAISLKPDNVAAYLNLHDLYRLRLKTGTSAAADILIEGMARAPESIDLPLTLARYYEGAGDAAQAKKYFVDARTLAEKAGNTARVADIQSEIDSL